MWRLIEGIFDVESTTPSQQHALSEYHIIPLRPIKRLEMVTKYHSNRVCEEATL